jgi:thioredoxin-related protein
MFCYEHFQVRAYPAVLMINEKGETLSRIDGLYPQDVINNILT